jgi:hypothetical protein
MLLFAGSVLPVSAQPRRSDAPAILSSAEALFQTMKDRNYTALWAVLTAKSRETILSDTDDAIRNAGGQPIPRERMREDFAGGGPVSRQYWEGFLRRFNPDDALENGRWEMGSIEQDRAEVLITRKGSDRPAVLRMFRERGGWKAGLVETFWEH